MATLTVIGGGGERTFEEHPTEIARRALMAAAEVETPEWAAVVLRFASALPHRGPLCSRTRTTA
jgi:hypothetical protein